jgi:hypothetical protein
MLCCPVQVEAFATGWSLVQRRPTVCLNKITIPPVCGGQGPYQDCRATDDDDDDYDSLSYWKTLLDKLQIHKHADHSGRKP